ncbi:MAG: ATP-binding protein [Pirellulales bacterium]
MLVPFRSRRTKAYAIAGISLVLATALRYYLDPFLGDHLSFSFYFLAVSLAAWTGGVWPAVITAVLSGLIGNYLFTHPQWSLTIHNHEEFFSLALFVAVSLIIGILSEVSLRALERAKTAERAKDEFMATVAHELRSPLSVIHYANALNRISGDEQARDQVDLIDRQVYQLNLLIEDLLDLSRVAHGKIRLDRDHVDASAVAEAALEKAKPLIAGHKHKLIVKLAPRPMPLYVDPVRVEQVLANLLINAAKYTPDGGEIGVTVAPADEYAVFTVRDNGIGIAPDMLPHVFELFAQSDRAAKRSNGGLGIGLALVRKLVEMHGGKVTANSAGPGRGSEFVVSLPLEKVPAGRVLVGA